MQITVVALGGMLGSVMRLLSTVLINSRQWTATAFPWGTLAVNVAGSLLIGMIFGYSLRNPNFGENWRLFLATGVCGGFTTFSAFSNETFQLFKEEQISVAFIYIAASLLLGIGATTLGYFITK